MIVNANMRELLPLRGAEAAGLPDDLLGILDEGWTVGGRGELILADEPPVGAVGGEPQELMGVELDHNVFAVDAEGLPEDRSGHFPAVLDLAFRFARAAIERAEGLPGAEDLAAVVISGIDEDFRTHGTKVRLFVRRGAVPHNYAELDGYKIEAIALVDLADLVAEPGAIRA